MVRARRRTTGRGGRGAGDPVCRGDRVRPVRDGRAGRGPADDPGTRRGSGAAPVERDGAPVSSSRAANAVDAPPTAGRRSRVRDVASGPAPTWTDREAAHGDRTGRAGGLGLLLATAAAGLSFSGTFAVSALLLPVLGVVTGVAAADQLTLGRPRVAALRSPLGVLLGATAGAAGLLLPGGVPLTGATLRAL